MAWIRMFWSGFCLNDKRIQEAMDSGVMFIMLCMNYTSLILK